jgi:hypothetical protein
MATAATSGTASRHPRRRGHRRVARRAAAAASSPNSPNSITAGSIAVLPASVGSVGRAADRTVSVTPAPKSVNSLQRTADDDHRRHGDNQCTDPPSNRGDSTAMKLKSPIVTLLVGVLIAVLVYAVSANSQPGKPYGAPAAAVAS